MRRRGFTLLELIAATAIFAVVIGAAYSLFDAGRGVTRRGEFRARLFQTARAALQALEEDLKGVVMSGSVYDTGLIATSGGSPKQPKDKVEAVAVNRFTGGERPENDEKDKRIDLSRVSWWIEEDASKKARGLVRERAKVLSPPGAVVRRDEDVQEIARDVVYLDLRWYGDAEWKESWDSSQTGTMPKAVEVTVYVRGEIGDDVVIEPFTARFHLSVAADTPEQEP